MLNIKQSNNLAPLTLALLAAGIGSCKPQEDARPAPQAKPAIDLSNWKADPKLPKPEFTTKVEIIKEPERQKVSMKVTVTETHDLTVHEVQFSLRYRVLNEETKQFEYPERMFTYKMIPKIEKGRAVFQTPIVEPNLRKVAWDSDNDNWDIEIRSFNQYYKE